MHLRTSLPWSSLFHNWRSPLPQKEEAFQKQRSRCHDKVRDFALVYLFSEWQMSGLSAPNGTDIDFAKFEGHFSSWTYVHSYLTCVRVRKEFCVYRLFYFLFFIVYFFIFYLFFLMILVMLFVCSILLHGFFAVYVWFFLFFFTCIFQYWVCALCVHGLRPLRLCVLLIQWSFFSRLKKI